MYKVAIALASVALLGASCSCSAKDFIPPVLDAVSFVDAPKAAISSSDLEEYYGTYSFRYGYLSDNRFNGDLRSVDSISAVTRYSFSDSSVFLALDNSYFDPYVYAVFGGVEANHTYTISLEVYEGALEYAVVDNGNHFTTSYSFVPSSSTFTFGIEPVGYSSSFGAHIMLVQGFTSKPFSPYGIGMSYATPITGAGTITYTPYLDGGDYYVPSVKAYEDADFKLYTDSIQFNFTGESAAGGVFSEFFGAAQQGAFSHNMYFEDNAEGWYEVGIVVEDPFDAYTSFVVEPPNGGGFEYGLFTNIQYISWTTYNNGEYYDSGLIYPDAVFYDDIKSIYYNGLLDVDAFQKYCTGSNTIREFEVYFRYLTPNNTDACPVYFDSYASGSTTDTSFMPLVECYRRSGSSGSPYCFSGYVDSTYAGLADRYASNRFEVWRENRLFDMLRLVIPESRVFVQLRYIGILSAYANGYADGVASRDGEVEDLTDRILGLEEDLEQYQGKSYDQIYNLGMQAGIEAGSNGGVRTFNALFGNILTAPLTILNGLGDLDFFGMPILTAILSLLMVAVALWLFKRFK